MKRQVVYRKQQPINGCGPKLDIQVIWYKCKHDWTRVTQSLHRVTQSLHLNMTVFISVREQGLTTHRECPSRLSMWVCDSCIVFGGSRASPWLHPQVSQPSTQLMLLWQSCFLRWVSLFTHKTVINNSWRKQIIIKEMELTLSLPRTYIYVLSAVTQRPRTYIYVLKTNASPSVWLRE